MFLHTKTKIASVVTEVQHSLWYATVMLVLALLSGGVLIYEILSPGTPSLVLWLQIDLIITFIFLTDFLTGLLFDRSYPNRREYLKDNWLNLVSSIPITTEVTSFLRILRAVRALRVIKLVRAGLNLTHSERKRRALRR
jgi:hypothetical protein